MFTPSKYQKAIFHWLRHGQGNGFVEAVAGSGKTTTLKQGAEELQGLDLLLKFLAFNTHIVKELTQKLPRGTDISTIHSVGNGLVKDHLGYYEVDGLKYRKLVQMAMKSRDFQALDQEARKAVEEGMVALIRYVHATLSDYNVTATYDYLVERYALDIKADYLPLVKGVLPGIIYQGISYAKSKKWVDFGDQLWLPHVWKLQPHRYDFLFCDESQDLTAAQRNLVMKMAREGGRMLFVGDEHQAIYGFTGADTESVRQIIQMTNATKMPLSICYRCPRSHVELAKQLVPQIEAAPDAIDGQVTHIELGEVAAYVKPGDMIICRTTAPLVELCFDLIRLGITARVRGREIGKDLSALLTGMSNLPTFDFARLDIALLDAEERLGDKAEDQARRDAFQDKVRSLRIIYQSQKPATLEQFHRAIESVFSDRREGVDLCTIHKAKGLEADRVIIIRPELMPHPNAKAAWQIQQERNLQYVAYTRAKRALFIAKTPAPEPKQDRYPASRHREAFAF